MNGMLLSDFLRLGQQAVAQYGDREVWLPGEEDEETEEGISISPLMEVSLAPIKLGEGQTAFLLLINGELVADDEEETTDADKR
jgi:hypothetical protein